MKRRNRGKMNFGRTIYVYGKRLLVLLLALALLLSLAVSASGQDYVEGYDYGYSASPEDGEWTEEAYAPEEETQVPEDEDEMELREEPYAQEEEELVSEVYELFGSDVTLEDLEAIGVLYIAPQGRGVMPLSSRFSAEEMEDLDMWYTVPDNVVTLAATPAATAYDRLRAAIHAAPAGQITHIVIPFHINAGTRGTVADWSIVGIRDGATVVMIGSHSSPSEAFPNGEIVISDNHSGTSRLFRVRGNGEERTALVARNIILQSAGIATAQGTPGTPPAPVAQPHTGNQLGGGVAIENGGASAVVAGIPGSPASGGGGHFILCQGAVIRNTSTDNRGPVDVQTNGRFTMMPGSLMQNNLAQNAGGAVNVNSATSVFNMRGGVIRDNLVNGVNTSSPLERGVGGAVIVRAGGTFNMFDGEIYGNAARVTSTALGTATAPTAIVTSSGGGVFVIGGGSSFNMYGGTIRDNEATRQNASNIGTAAGQSAARANFRAGNGGGVYLTGGATFYMHGGSIRDNDAATAGTLTGLNALNVSNGGGVYLTGAGTTFSMYGGEVRGNVAHRTVNSAPTLTGVNAVQVFAGNGGGVHVFDGASFYLSGGAIVENTASRADTQPTNNATNPANLSNGGGVFVSGVNSTFHMSGGEIRENIATGGLATTAAVVLVSGNGGGVALLHGARFEMDLPNEGGIFDNRAAISGGGVFALGANTVFELDDGVIRGNEADLGGGVRVLGGAAFTMRDGEIGENVAHLDGGGVHVYGRARDVAPQLAQAAIVGARFQMDGGTIRENAATFLGGGGCVRNGGPTEATRALFVLTG
ncbi:MAG: hypothetical protein FWD84_04845, partial [Oscillospiraceae bacterium]|nr:hypothetical protein [Oscillospiraceae bacterium]